MIKVVSIEFSAWMVEGANNAEVLGEFPSQDEAVTAIWMHLVQNRQHRAYLMFERNTLLLKWFPPKAIVWGTLQDGLPRIYQEHMDRFSAKKAFKMYHA